MSNTRVCWIYKSSKKDEMYLYLARQDDFEVVPSELMKRFGQAQLVMELELSPDKKLARENTQVVINNLLENGFHLQLPPVLKPELYHGNLD